MSSLGYLSLFRQLDERPDVAVHRLTTEALNPSDLKDAELMGLSFAFELDVVEILKAFEALRIPTFSDHRNDDHPLVFAGGPVVITNPEPYADFFDFFIIGEGEEAMDKLMTVFSTVRHLPRAEQLLALAQQVPGVYVPSLYEVVYAPPTNGVGGPIQAILPKVEGIPFPVQKQVVSDMSATIASSPILSPEAIFPNTFMVEVMRGCPHRCRFCLASYSMLPARGPGLGLIQSTIEQGLKHTNRIGLVGALIAEHPEFESLCEFLRTQPSIEIGSASLRADTLTDTIAQTFVHGGQKTVTIAVESGSERLRHRINKHLKTEAIYNAAAILERAGIPQLKLYMMVGLPDETMDDLAETVALVKGLKKAHPRLKLTFGCSTHVPKAATPFQWVARESVKSLQEKHWYLQKHVSRLAAFRPTSPKWDHLQAILSRGDRRLAPWLVAFVQAGGNLGAINRATKGMASVSLRHPLPDLDALACDQRSADTIHPWDVLHLGVSKDTLFRESGIKPI